MANQSKRGVWIIAIIGVVLITACICVAIIGAGGLALFTLRHTINPPSEATQVESIPQTDQPEPDASAEPDSGSPDPNEMSVFPTGTPEPGAEDTLNTLRNAEVPFADLRLEAMQFKGIPSIPETVAFPGEFNLGDESTFWVLNTDTNRYSQVKTVLAYKSAHLYFWIEKGLKYDSSDLEKLGDAFENKIYPTDREFFGSEWTPGVDGDEHLYIIYAGNMGENLAGMFSSADSVNPLAYPYSNGHESFFLNADTTGLDENYTYGVLAHEFQHMIHWYRDRNEETWLSEGFSELAVYLNGYDVGGFDSVFLSQPSTQLNNWPDNSDSDGANYGAAFLFVNYFLERFGEEATQRVVASPLNGLESIDQVLEDLKATYPDSDQPYRADDLFADWVVANAVNDPTLDDGRFGYSPYQLPFEARSTDELRDCLGGWQANTVNQYGTNYIDLACSGQRTLDFEGASQVDLLPEDPHSGDYAFWSNQGDESQMLLSHSFDLTGVSGPVEFDYWTWYDIERDYDYLYLQASEDGTNWTILTPPTCTDSNPTGANYGCGYNGSSSGWIEEKVDLSAYAGKKIWLRFAYVTDAAVNGEGMLLDDVSIPAIGYHSDFESDNGGWQAEGFARIQNRLPQSFRLALILEGDQTSIQTLTWTPGETLKVPVDFDAYDRVTLVVSGTTRFTRQPGAYRIQVNP
ncbi:uncharacterized protein conserved in bacteria [Longilinea arvoryzae]|uniref:Uncharacterized protein conserved in bacteria n=1 Tax=Longilinea arvoryzae TaxID=360412 RepID=A0A0S7BNA0_9CHLR|nr:choice-of-anchor J domain-containing protein [Longilinea arvoryzae]GAP15226.1 uncharacterized protein conserved in bacteria [Longilinea arvoryzae]